MFQKSNASQKNVHWINCKNRPRSHARLLPALLMGGSMGMLFTGGAAFAADEKKINLCNKNSETIYIAVAYEAEVNKPLIARGWWGIEQNKCLDLSLPVATDRLLVHGQSASQINQWVGEKPLCVNELEKFDYDGAEAMPCNLENQKQRSFKEVSIAALSSLSSDGVPTVEFLPNEAVKVGNTVKVCNDSGETAYISYSQKKSASEQIALRGWFKIGAGSCYEVLRDPSASELLLFGQSETAEVRWSGTEALCTDDYRGFNFDDARTMDCTGINQRLQLFQKLQMPDAADFEFRLRSEDGRKARSVVDLCNVSGEKIYVAVAYESKDFPGQIVSSGWYNVDSAQCFKDLPVDADQLFLRVENESHHELLGGQFQACVHTTQAYEFGNATQMQCTGDLEMATFAVRDIDAGKVSLNLP